MQRPHYSESAPPLQVQFTQRAWHRGGTERQVGRGRSTTSMTEEGICRRKREGRSVSCRMPGRKLVRMRNHKPDMVIEDDIDYVLSKARQCRHYIRRTHSEIQGASRTLQLHTKITCRIYHPNLIRHHSKLFPHALPSTCCWPPSAHMSLQLYSERAEPASPTSPTDASGNPGTTDGP